MMASAPIPPTTPPAMAPTLVFFWAPAPTAGAVDTVAVVVAVGRDATIVGFCPLASSLQGQHRPYCPVCFHVQGGVSHPNCSDRDAHRWVRILLVHCDRNGAVLRRVADTTTEHCTDPCCRKQPVYVHGGRCWSERWRGVNADRNRCGPDGRHAHDLEPVDPPLIRANPSKFE